MAQPDRTRTITQGMACLALLSASTASIAHEPDHRAARRSCHPRNQPSIDRRPTPADGARSGARTGPAPHTGRAPCGTTARGRTGRAPC